MPSHSESPSSSFRIDLLPLIDVALIDIAWNDAAYSLSPSETAPDAALVQSLCRVGMIVPPLLSEAGLVILTGRRRLIAWQSLGRDHAGVRLAPASVSPADLLAMAVEETKARQGLTTVERAMAVRAFERLTGRTFATGLDDAVWRERLDVGDSPGALERLKQFGAMPDEVLAMLANGRLPEAAVPWLAEFNEPSHREAIAHWVASLGLTTGETSRTLRELLEVCTRDQVAPGELLTRIAPPEKAGEDRRAVKAAVLEALRRLRYPVLTATEHAWRHRHDALGLPSGCRIVPPRDFEGDGYRIEARIRNPEDLRRLAKSLTDLLDRQPDRVRDLLEPEAEA